MPEVRVKIKGFQLASSLNPEIARNEQDYINTYFGKIGTIVNIDKDKDHPYHVQLQTRRGPAICRFSKCELELA